MGPVQRLVSARIVDVQPEARPRTIFAGISLTNGEIAASRETEGVVRALSEKNSLEPAKRAPRSHPAGTPVISACRAIDAIVRSPRASRAQGGVWADTG